MRGIGLVGAVSKFEEYGYRFRNVAGSSAGAIIASLIAAGYTADELHEELTKVEFGKFKQSAFWHGLGPIGAAIGAAKNFGMYSATYFEKWLEELLAKKGVSTFADIKRSLKLTASDITDGKMIVLPDDLQKFGIEPADFKVATAVRMSMSIPLFFEPYKLVDKEGLLHYIVDGGMLSNYPIWLLDDGKKLDVPVFGIRFARSTGQEKSRKDNIFTYIKQLVSTAIDVRENEYQIFARGDKQRTVTISTRIGKKPVSMTDFEMSRELIDGMYNNGVYAADIFLREWDFRQWKRDYRSNPSGIMRRFFK